MFEVVDEEVERCHQSQEDVAESNKRSMLDETDKDSFINWKEGNIMMRVGKSLPLFLEASPVA